MAQNNSPGNAAFTMNMHGPSAGLSQAANHRALDGRGPAGSQAADRKGAASVPLPTRPDPAGTNRGAGELCAGADENGVRVGYISPYKKTGTLPVNDAVQARSRPIFQPKRRIPWKRSRRKPFWGHFGVKIQNF